MSKSFRQRLQSFIGELKRRHVTQVVFAYALIGFGLMQAADTFFPALNFPDWTVTVAATLIIAGLPIAICLAWAFDITPQGVQPAQDEPGGPLRSTPRRLAVVSVVVITVAVAGAFMVTRVSTAGHSINALAVLPFDNMSGDTANAYFSDGMTEEVLTHLAKIDGLTVISRTSVMQYKGATKTTPQIANELRVGAILEGSVQRVGDNVRITAQLIDASRDKHIWAESYDRRITDIFEVQSEIAREIAAALRTRLTAEKRAQLERVANQSPDPHAYDEYLRALQHAAANRRQQSTEHLLRAIEIDPRYARAHAALARNYYYQVFLSAQAPEAVAPRLKAASERALHLDPDLADAHATRALYLLHFARDFRGAEAAFKRALELEPGNAEVRHDYAHYLLAAGRSAESAAETVRAAELDPANAMLTACVGWHRFADRHYQAALDGAGKALMMMPMMPWPKIILAWAHLHTSDHERAVALLREAVGARQRPFAKAALAHALAVSGQRAEATHMLGELLQLRSPDYVSAYDIAVIYAGLGDFNESFAWLERAKTERSTFLVFIRWDPRFDVLRDDARYATLVRDLRLPHANA